MSANLYEAHRQWINRPPDERFSSLEALQLSVTARRTASREYPRKIRSIALTATPKGGMALNGHTETAYLTHWAFSQLCVTLSAPPRYLRSLPPPLARECLQHAIGRDGGECKLLMRQPVNERDARPTTIAAVTGPTYGRIWDADVVEAVSGAVKDTEWRPPPDQEGNPSGLYASDRDMFLFFINDEKPVEVAGSRLGRGFFCWNSETGAASFGLTTFLYNHICGNHIVWGAEDVREVRIEHRDRALHRFRDLALPALDRYVSSRNSGDQVERAVKRATTVRLGDSLDDVLGWFSAKPFARTEIVAGWKAAGAEHEDPTTLWGMIQGMTAHARTIPFTNARVRLERRAGRLLASASPS